MSAPQLPLHLRWRESPRLDDFVAGENAGARAAVEALARGEPSAPRALVLRGGAATGKTHLLLAACRECADGGGSAAYLPLAELRGADASAGTEGLERSALLCVDDLQAVAGDRAWEEALFHLYNRCEAGGARLLVASRPAVSALGLGLPDLVSRLNACVTLALRPLEDDDRAEVLRRRARARGLELGEEVTAYLLARHARDLHSLTALFERLDAAALAGKRRITVPLVREVLEKAGARRA